MPLAFPARGSVVDHGAVSVATTATSIHARIGRYSISVYNNGSQTVYLGNSTVTTSTGFPVVAGASFEAQVTSAIYGIVASGTADVRYWSERS